MLLCNLPQRGLYVTGLYLPQPGARDARLEVRLPHLLVSSLSARAFVFLHMRKINALDEVSDRCGQQWRRRMFIERLKDLFCLRANAGLRLVLCIDRRKTDRSLHGSQFTAYTCTLTVSQDPPAATPHDVAGLLSVSHFFFSVLCFGFPSEALPPNAAMRLRACLLSFLERASPAIRAISRRRAGLNFAVRALPPARLRAAAALLSGVGLFLVVMGPQH